MHGKNETNYIIEKLSVFRIEIVGFHLYTNENEYNDGNLVLFLMIKRMYVFGEIQIIRNL